MDKQDISRLDYRNNLIVDPNNPILIQKAWRGGQRTEEMRDVVEFVE